MYSIYKIWKDDLCYVGITTDFRVRMLSHKSICLNQEARDANCKVYQAIRTNGGWEAWVKEVVETTDDKTRERYWVELIGNLNSQVPTRNRKEWRKTKEKTTCECGVKYTRSNKSYHIKSNKHLTHINTNG
jgi:hypothetical protein